LEEELEMSALNLKGTVSREQQAADVRPTFRAQTQSAPLSSNLVLAQNFCGQPANQPLRQTDRRAVGGRGQAELTLCDGFNQVSIRRRSGPICFLRLSCKLRVASWLCCCAVRQHMDCLASGRGSIFNSGRRITTSARRWLEAAQ